MPSLNTIITLRELVFSTFTISDIIGRVIRVEPNRIELVSDNVSHAYIKLTDTDLEIDTLQGMILSSIIAHIQAIDEDVLNSALFITKEQAVSIMGKADPFMIVHIAPSLKDDSILYVEKVDYSS